MDALILMDEGCALSDGAVADDHPLSVLICRLDSLYTRRNEL